MGLDVYKRQATAEAQEQLSAKAVRDMQYGRNARTKHLRALRREAKAARLEAETEVRREVMRQPVYQAWQKLTAKLTDADKIGRPETPKFSPQAVSYTHLMRGATAARLPITVIRH